jgi:hypothetical protein
MQTLVETQYLPPIDLFSQLSDSQAIVIESCENYQKRSFRNRCDIATANGIQTLTIPLESGKNAQQSIRDVKISTTERWQAQHWQAIRSAYGRAPYFEHYVDYLLPFYEKNYTFLFDFNQDLFLVLTKLLKINTPISLTDVYEKTYSSESYIDLRNKMRDRTQPLSTAFKKYPQVFEDRHGFLPNLSSLDLLFCMGAQGKSYF